MTTRIEEPTKKGDRSDLQKLWVPIVLAIGFVAGEVLSYETAIPQVPGRRRPVLLHLPLPSVPFQPALRISRPPDDRGGGPARRPVVVYGRMYVETKANFALGLVVVLIALLAQALLSYPILQGLIGPLYPGVRLLERGRGHIGRRHIHDMRVHGVPLPQPGLSY